MIKQTLFWVFTSLEHSWISHFFVNKHKFDTSLSLSLSLSPFLSLSPPLSLSLFQKIIVSKIPPRGGGGGGVKAYLEK